jgi:hypothetical protein
VASPAPLAEDPTARTVPQANLLRDDRAFGLARDDVIVRGVPFDPPVKDFRKGVDIRGMVSVSSPGNRGGPDPLSICNLPYVDASTDPPVIDRPRQHSSPGQRLR